MPELELCFAENYCPCGHLLKLIGVEVLHDPAEVVGARGRVLACVGEPVERLGEVRVPRIAAELLAGAHVAGEKEYAQPHHVAHRVTAGVFVPRILHGVELSVELAVKEVRYHPGVDGEDGVRAARDLFLVAAFRLRLWMRTIRSLRADTSDNTFFSRFHSLAQRSTSGSRSFGT